MKFSFLILLGCLLPVAAVLAQADERSFEERLLRPDLTRDPNIGGRKIERSNASVGREFEGRKAFATGSFDTRRQEPKRFLGIPVPWFGDKKVPAKQYAGADREFVTRVATAFEKDNSALGEKAFADGERTAYPDARDIPMRKANIVGKDQKNLDAQNQELSVEEVRELLNKR